VSLPVGDVENNDPGLIAPIARISEKSDPSRRCRTRSAHSFVKRTHINNETRPGRLMLGQFGCGYLGRDPIR
jgi:hypothetical protein